MTNKIETAGTFIDGHWRDGQGPEFQSLCPVDNQVVWEGNEADMGQVDQAFAAARQAFGPWWDQTSDARIGICETFADNVQKNGEELAEIISRETGKPRWESKTEVAAVVGKIQVSIEAFRTRRDTTSFEMGEMNAVTRFKPYGVCGVIGPFNFPAHLPNGHMVPAIIAGNTVVFKPSEQTPAVGQWLVQQWNRSGLPTGVINLVQGGRDVGVGITNHEQLDGLFFTGSNAAGLAIHRAFAETPQKILALEMGGNGPVIVHAADDLRAAAYLTILSAYYTAGQRCTCARRLILVDEPRSDEFMDILVNMIGDLRIGFFTDDPEPFMGTVISGHQGRQLLAGQNELIGAGGRPILEMQRLRDCDALLSPGLIDITGIDVDDEEMFGPLLKVSRVSNFDAAIDEANNTKYGLSAALLSDDRDCYENFIHRIRAGIVNWNRQTTGASGRMPFGGCGYSGNNRPAAFYAADYCSWPVASLESNRLALPDQPITGIKL